MFTFSPIRRRIIAISVLMAVTGLAHADEYNDIIAAKKLRVGIDLNTPPNGMLDASGGPTGSDVETAKLLAKDMGVEFVLIPTNVANRISSLKTGKVDLIISSFSISPEREKEIDFSAPYAAIKSVIAAPKSLSIKGFSDLSGLKINSTKGTTNDQVATEGATASTFVRFDSNAQLVAAALSGQADIIAASPGMVKSIKEKKPSLGYEIKFVMKSFPIGIGLRKGETKLHDWLNEWVAKNRKNNKLSDIYQHYHE